MWKRARMHINAAWCDWLGLLSQSRDPLELAPDTVASLSRYQWALKVPGSGTRLPSPQSDFFFLKVNEESSWFGKIVTLMTSLHGRASGSFCIQGWRLVWVCGFYINTFTTPPLQTTTFLLACCKVSFIVYYFGDSFCWEEFERRKECVENTTIMCEVILCTGKFTGWVGAMRYINEYRFCMPTEQTD